QLSAWESRSAALYFQYLQNGSSKMYVHALHTVHALPDLRVAGGRLGDGSSAAGFVGSAFQLCRRVRAQLNEAARRFSMIIIENSKSRPKRSWPHILFWHR